MQGLIYTEQQEKGIGRMGIDRAVEKDKQHEKK